MACIDDQQPNFKHYCRVCKKGFMCGRALGGHMRAHGIGDESGNLDEEDDDPMSDWEEKFGGPNKKMYQLRTNPNRLKSCRTCENCGKEFVSWKSFLEHGKCSSDESLISDSEGEDTRSHWSKRKRSVRSKVGSSEEDDILLARCLVQLANSVVEFHDVEPEESCASANPKNKAKGVSVSVLSPKGMFECKACKKVFSSHQALGGHRASHKKVKGCYAAKHDMDENNNVVIEEDNNNTMMITDNTNDEEFMIPPSKPASSHFQFGHAAARRKSKVHECSICHRVFASGQALGGHKRCHWITSNSAETSSLPKLNFQDSNIVSNSNNLKPKIDKLDLNVPAWAHFMRDPPPALTLQVVSTDMKLEPGPRCVDDSNNAKNESADEADSKSMKLMDLKEMDNSGSSSQWLKVGIGSANEAAADV